MTVAIRVENLSKYYRLGMIGGQTLKEDVNRWWARLRGKPDPLRPVDAHGREREDEEMWALRDITFDVGEGEILGVVGHNGAGKSTLLKVLTRITAPTKGRIMMRGKVASLLEVGTGFHPELTGRENVYLNGAILGMSKSEIDLKFDEIVSFAGVERFVETPVKRYSSGMHVRLGFAVAAHLEPEILLVDEVLAVGDAGFQQRCLGKMEEVARGGRTIIFVSHNTASIRRLCSRAIMLEDGRMVMDGDSREVTDHYLQSLAETGPASDALPPGYLYRNPTPAPDEDCAITGLQLLSLDGEPISILRTWDTVRIRVTFQVRRAIERGSVALTVTTQDGSTLALFSTQPDGNMPLSMPEGEGKVDLIIDRWPFAAGSYAVGAGVAVPGLHFLWWRERLCELRVEERDVFESGLSPNSRRYLVATDHRWEKVAVGVPSGEFVQ